MATTDTRYTARFSLPDLIEVGRDNVLRCPVFHDGTLAEPTSGTATLLDADGTVRVDEAMVTITDDVATYSLSSSIISTADLGEGWVIEWAMVMPDGVTHTFRNDASLVRRRLYPTIADLDLFRRESGLDPSGGDPITSLSDFQDYIDEADTEIQGRLIEQGNRPNLIVSPSALRSVWLYLTLHLVFQDLSTRLNPAYAEKAKHYRDLYERAWSRLSFLYDTDDDGQVSDPHRRRGARPTYWLSGRVNG